MLSKRDQRAWPSDRRLSGGLILRHRTPPPSPAGPSRVHETASSGEFREAGLDGRPVREEGNNRSIHALSLADLMLIVAGSTKRSITVSKGTNNPGGVVPFVGSRAGAVRLFKLHGSVNWSTLAGHPELVRIYPEYKGVWEPRPAGIAAWKSNSGRRYCFDSFLRRRLRFPAFSSASSARGIPLSGRRSSSSSFPSI